MSADIRRALPPAAALLAGLMLCAGLAGAQSTEGEARLRAQLRDSTLQLRQAQDENASLRAHQQELEQQLKAGGAAPTKGRDTDTSALRKALAQRDERLSDLQEQLIEAQVQLKRSQESSARTDGELRTSTGEVAQLRSQLQERQAAYERLQEQLRLSEDKNRELVNISGELLSAYEGKGVWSTLTDAEPLTQIHRVRLQTLAQDYQIKIKDRTLAAPAPQAPTPRP